MKKLLIGLFMTSPIMLTACNSVPSTYDENKPIGTPNPASVYCLEQGGKLIRKTEKNVGEYSLCQLPNGQIIEEWELFRKDHPLDPK